MKLNLRSKMSILSSLCLSIVLSTKANAAAYVDPAVYQQLHRGQSVEVIVEFDVTHANKQLAAQKLKRFVRTKDANKNKAVYNQFLGERKRLFADMKHSVLAGVNKRKLRVRKHWKHLPNSFLVVDDLKTLRLLKNRKGVKAIYGNEEMHPSVANSLPFIDQDVIANRGYGGAGTSVAVIDTGVNFTLDVFGNCTAPGVPDTCRVPFAQDFFTDDRQMDAAPNEHGTNVAGIVASVAPETQILSLDVFNERIPNTASSADTLDALDWVLANREAFNIVAVNLSLGGGSFTGTCVNSYATGVFQQLRQADVLPVVAAGNNGWSTAMNRPACTPGAVSVGNYNHFWLTQDGTSNSNDLLTIWAPGRAINVPGTVAPLTGTSQAAPHVAGTVALLRAADSYPLDSSDQTQDRLVNSQSYHRDTRNNIRRPLLNVEGSYTNHGTQRHVYRVAGGTTKRKLWGESAYANVAATADAYCALLGYEEAASYQTGGCGEDESDYWRFNTALDAWETKESGSKNRCYAMITRVECRGNPNAFVNGHGDQNDVFIHTESASSKRLWGESHYADVQATANQYCRLLGFNQATNILTDDCGEDESDYMRFNPGADRWEERASGSKNRCYALISSLDCQ